MGCNRVGHCRADSVFRAVRRPGCCHSYLASCIHTAQNLMNHSFPSQSGHETKWKNINMACDIFFCTRHFYFATSNLVLRRGGLNRAQCVGRVYRRKEEGVGGRWEEWDQHDAMS